MNGKNLREYLAIVVELEKQIYMQKQLERELLERKNQLCIENLIEEPSIPKVETIRDEHSRSTVLGWEFIGGSVLGWCFFRMDFWWHGALGFVGCLGLMGAVMFLLMGVALVFQTWRESSLIDEREQESIRVWREYEEKVKKNQKRISQEKIQRIYLDSEIKKLEEKLNKSQMNLRTIYSYGIIFPKYQNFVMVSSIYEYICSGRCSTLEGHEGAYNILEMELRLDRIIGKLDDIIQKLNQIKDNQYIVCHAIQAANDMCSSLIENSISMEKKLETLVKLNENTNEAVANLQNNSEIQKYILSQTQKELDYMNRMNYLAGNYKSAVYGPNF